MTPKKNLTLTVGDSEITLITSNKHDGNDYLSLTDIAKYKNPEDPSGAIKNWLRRKDTLAFLGLWERLNNQNFNSVEFDRIESNAGTNAFTLSPKKWVDTTNATGIITKAGRYGGTYAHKDIAFEFASWISPEFKLYVITDYQRLKEEEGYRLSEAWDVRRAISRANYQIHTDAIKEYLITNKLSKQQIGYTYANEADVLNVALFGQTAKDWRMKNPDAKGNMRDYASIEQLIILSNLESINAKLIQDGYSQQERLIELNKLARDQQKSLLNNKSIKSLEKGTPNF